MADISKITLNGTDYNIKDSNAQETLVSGTNIKTINNESILGSGNITISGGSGSDTEELQLVAAAGINDTRMSLAAEIRNNHFTKDEIIARLKAYATKADFESYVQVSVLTDLLSAVYDLITESELVTAAALNDLKINIQ